MELKDSVVLQIDSEDEIKMGSAYVVNYQGKECMLFWSTKKDQVFLYQLSGSGKGMHIPLDSLNKTIELLQLNYSFCYHANESMFGLSPNNDTIYCFDINGIIKKRWPLASDKIISPNIIRLICGEYSHLGYYDEKNKMFYLINCFDPMTKSIQGFFDQDRYLAIDLSENVATLAFTFGQFPSSYTRRQYQGISCSEDNMVFYNNIMLVNFYASDSIYRYERNDYRKKGYYAYDASSNGFAKDNTTYDTTKESDRDYINQYSMENERYSLLLCRNNAEYLFRLVDKKYPLYNEDSTINFAMDQPWNIVLLNKELNIVGELPIPEKKLNRTQFIPYKNGFWIASLEDYRKFYYYEIKLP